MRYLLLTLLSFFCINTASAADVLYPDVDIQSISKALFKKGILKTSDPAAVEEYIRIQECGLYELYGRDDFAWTRLRESMAQDIDVKKEGFAEGLSIVNTVALDNYDLSTNEFTIVEDEKLHNMALITLIDERAGNLNPCASMSFSAFVPRVHPLELVVKVDNPVTMSGIPMSANAAKALIAQMNERTGLKAQNREVVFVFELRITGMDPLTASNNAVSRTVLGQLDALRVYADASRKNLIYMKTFQTKK